MKAREAVGPAARRSALRATGQSAGDDTKGRKNMKFLNVEIPVKNLPELDQGFVPLGLFFKHYAMGATKPLCIAVERSGGADGM